MQLQNKKSDFNIGATTRSKTDPHVSKLKASNLSNSGLPPKNDNKNSNDKIFVKRN